MPRPCIADASPMHRPCIGDAARSSEPHLGGLSIRVAKDRGAVSPPHGHGAQSCGGPPCGLVRSVESAPS
eukprot:9479878-Pyramimonas_sp.AAC.1